MREKAFACEFFFKINRKLSVYPLYVGFAGRGFGFILTLNCSNDVFSESLVYFGVSVIKINIKGVKLRLQPILLSDKDD